MIELRQKLEKLTQQKKPLVATGIIVSVILLLIVVLVFIKSADRGIEWQDSSGSTLGFAVSHPAGWTVEEEDATSGPDILISDANSFAFVRIRGFLDPAIFNNRETIVTSIAEYKKALLLQDGVLLNSFQEETGENTGGFLATGEFPINDIVYRFEERGQLFSTLGQVIIMRAADIPKNFDSSIVIMRKIMESFKQE